MSAGIRSALTLAVLGLLVVVAAVAGMAALTKPFPKSEAPPLCTDTDLAVGDVLFADRVVVTVYNASARTGLARLTMDKLVERGFIAAGTENAPDRAKATKIISDNPDDPAVQLVRKQFRGAKVVDGDLEGPGVVVAVGENFKDLRKKAPESIEVATAATICAGPDTR